MKAWSWDRYGPPDVLTFKDIDEPDIASDEVLVRVRAVSVNPYDWRHVRADPKLVRLSVGLRWPKPGRNPVTSSPTRSTTPARSAPGIRPGDEVFGEVRLG